MSRIEGDPRVVLARAQAIEDAAAEPAVRGGEPDRGGGSRWGASHGGSRGGRGVSVRGLRREAAPGSSRAGVAMRVAGLADDRTQIHRGVGPGAGLVGRNGGVGDGLEVRRRHRVVRADDDPPEDPADVHVDGTDRDAVGQRRHGAGRVRPDPRQCLELRHARGHPAAMLLDDDPRGPLEGDRPPVVAEAGPFAQDVGRARGGERLHRGKAGHEPLPVRRRSGRLRLLGHRLRHEDRVRVGRPAEGQRTTAFGVPGEDRGACLGWEGGLVGHGSQDSPGAVARDPLVSDAA